MHTFYWKRYLKKEQKRQRHNQCERVGLCHKAEAGEFPELFYDGRWLTFRNFTIVSPLEW